MDLDMLMITIWAEPKTIPRLNFEEEISIGLQHERGTLHALLIRHVGRIQFRCFSFDR